MADTKGDSAHHELRFDINYILSELISDLQGALFRGPPNVDEYVTRLIEVFKKHRESSE